MARGPAIVRTTATLDRAIGKFRDAGQSLALVPTMGALHAGHIALVRRDGSELDFAVAGVRQFFAMGKGYVQAVTDTGMWILRVEPGAEQIFLLPGISE
jgi:hypothetical protein